MANKLHQLTPDQRVEVFAAKDIMAPDPKDKTGKKQVVVVPRGTMQKVFRVDARERCQTGDWTMNDPRVSRRPTATTATSFKLTDVPGISRRTADALIAADYGTLESLRGATADDLTKVDGVGTKYAQAILLHIEQHFPDPNAVPEDDDEDEGDEGGEG